MKQTWIAVIAVVVIILAIVIIWKTMAKGAGHKVTPGPPPDLAPGQGQQLLNPQIQPGGGGGAAPGGGGG